MPHNYCVSIHAASICSAFALVCALIITCSLVLACPEVQISCMRCAHTYGWWRHRRQLGRLETTLRPAAAAASVSSFAVCVLAHALLFCGACAALQCVGAFVCLSWCTLLCATHLIHSRCKGKLQAVAPPGGQLHWPSPVSLCGPRLSTHHNFTHQQNGTGEDAAAIMYVGSCPVRGVPLP